MTFTPEGTWGLNSDSRLVPLDLNLAVPKRLENGI